MQTDAPICGFFEVLLVGAANKTGEQNERQFSRSFHSRISHVSAFGVKILKSCFAVWRSKNRSKSREIHRALLFHGSEHSNRIDLLLRTVHFSSLIPIPNRKIYLFASLFPLAQTRNHERRNHRSRCFQRSHCRSHG